MFQIISTWMINRFGFCQRQQQQQDESNSNYYEQLSFVLLYCLILSISYVGSLYVLIPSKIRKLDRDHPLQIQWRSFASLTVSFIAMISYPIIFCCKDDESNEESSSFLMKDIFEYTLLSNFKSIIGILIHTMTLYLGPIMVSLLRVYEIRKLKQQKQSYYYIQDVIDYLIKPNFHTVFYPSTIEYKWINIRNYVVAPLTEEIVFRGCMVPALLLTTMSSMMKVSFLAPLFFGIAHIHHAITKLIQGNKVMQVVIVTLFQFVYTTMFGWYASYAYIRNGSILAVIVCHSYCNFMGLPDLSFLSKQHPLHKHRPLLLATYVLGIFSFKYMFQIESILGPIPGVLLI